MKRTLGESLLGLSVLGYLAVMFVNVKGFVADPGGWQELTSHASTYGMIYFLVAVVFAVPAGIGYLLILMAKADENDHREKPAAPPKKPSR